MSPGEKGIGGIREILLVEDSLGAVRLMEEALKESQQPTHLSVVRDGEEALTYLRQQGGYANRVRPALILLDSNLPKKDGFQVLAEIRQDVQLKDISVVVMTSSANPLEVRRAYDLCANCCLTKPIHLEQFFKLVKALV